MIILLFLIGFGLGLLYAFIGDMLPLYVPEVVKKRRKFMDF